MSGRAGLFFLLGWTSLLAGCAPSLTTRVQRDDPRLRYEQELRRAGPHGESLARAWSEAGASAAHASPRVALPYRETVLLPETGPGAVAYRFTLGHGDRFHVRVDAVGSNPPPLLELFEVVRGDRERLVLIAHASRGDGSLRSLAPRAGDYVLLVQPRLEHGGRYRIALGSGAEVPVTASLATLLPGALRFPVEGRTTRAIGSGFGEPRDGGARRHNGVDIFAPRGTSVLAAAAGVITNVANTPIGGRVVWQRVDGGGLELYYAHLDEQHVRVGQRVAAGDRIGTVGNTGNARGTSPHLHFAVYTPGRTPVDPAPLLAERRILTESPVANANGTIPHGVDEWVDEDAAAALGEWLRLQLAPDTPVQLLGASADWFRVRLPGGEHGFVQADALALFDRPLRTIGIRGRTPLRTHASANAAILETIFGGERVDVLGEYGGHLLVRTVSGRVGWIDGQAE